MDGLEIHEDEQCGSCGKNKRVIDVSKFGSDPYITNLLCMDCLESIAELLAPRDKVNAEAPRDGEWKWKAMEREV